MGVRARRVGSSAAVRPESGKSRLLQRVLTVLGVLGLTATLVQVPAAAFANPTAGFNPSNIISDSNFYDGYGIDDGGIQSFLNQRVPRCTIGDPGRAPGSAWGNTRIAQNCLRDARFTTTSRTANAYCKAYPGGVNESAATIIGKVGRACGINPKVLLVMLEKEQSLVTDTWPTVRQFDVAMGYACPDSGPNNSANCDPSQTGFYQQVYRSAWQLKVYRAHPDSYNYKPFRNNTIQWHPNVGCGTSQVYIENWATAALYIYTPYRPNQAALNAGWGTGDACSSYGNRNFYNFYNSWFGSPSVGIDSRLAGLYASLNGTLGGITGNAQNVGGGIRQQLERGTMYWHQNTGAQVVKGWFRDFYDAQGGATGQAGFPRTGEYFILDGLGQDFERASLYQRGSTPVFSVKGLVREYQVSIGGIKATGFPIAGEKLVARNTWKQDYQNGALYLSGTEGAFLKPGKIRDYVEANGLWDLGSQAGAQVDVAGGVVQEFSDATLNWSQTGGYVPVRGYVRNYQQSIGGAKATGVALAKEQLLPHQTWKQEYQNGTLYLSGTDGAFLKPGKLRDYVEKNGLWKLGAQKGQQIEAGGGFAQEFASQTLFWSPTNGYVTAGGWVRDYQQKQAGGVGSTGLALTQEQLLPHQTWKQEYQNGTLFLSAQDGAFLKPGPIRDFVEKDGLWSLGAQKSAQQDVAGGTIQEFANATLYSSQQAGLFSVGGFVRNYQLSIGGFSATGFPLSDEQLQADRATWRQEFQNGTLYLKGTQGRFEKR